MSNGQQNHVKTFTLAIALSDDVVLACIPDEGDLVKAVKEHMNKYDEIGIVRGVVLTSDPMEGDTCVHSFHYPEFSPLKDEDGIRYRYAVEREGFSIQQRLLRRKAA